MQDEQPRSSLRHGQRDIGYESEQVRKRRLHIPAHRILFYLYNMCKNLRLKKNFKYNSLKASLNTKKSGSIPKSLRTKYNQINKRIQIEDRWSNIDLIDFSLRNVSSGSVGNNQKPSNQISDQRAKVKLNDNKNKEEENGSSSSDSSSDSDSEAPTQRNRKNKKVTNQNRQNQTQKQTQAVDQTKRQDINQKIYNQFFDNNFKGVVDSFLENFASNQNTGQEIKTDTIKYLSKAIYETVIFCLKISLYLS